MDSNDLGSLKGEAAKVLDPIAVTSDNYEIAWSLITERYENKALITKNHIRALFNLPTVSKEYTPRNFFDEFQKRYRALEVLNETVKSWDTLLIHLLSIKLDSKSASLWDESIIHKKCSSPKLSELLNFLNDRCKLIEMSDYKSKTETQDCKVCSEKHNTMLHIYANKNESIEDIDASPRTNLSVVVNYSSKPEIEILLSTASSNFMTIRLAKRLQLPFAKSKIPVVGVGNSTVNISETVNTAIKSQTSSYTKGLCFLVLEKLTENLPSSDAAESLLNIPEHALADKNFNKSKSIDLLLGVQVFYEALCSQQIRLGNDSPILQQTLFGWVISGPITNCSNKFNNILCNLSVSNRLEQQLENFWQVEECPTIKYITPEEEQCERIFRENLKRDDAGRFVTLPIRKNVDQIGESYESAIKRLHSIERKFKRDVEFKSKYVELMREYDKLGHMEKISRNCLLLDQGNNLTFYLPHHGISKETSFTTSLRVVFDGSCRSSSGISLNDILMVGSCIQDDLFSILLRFRKHNIVLTADVAKMYRQVKIAERQRDLQIILWRENEKDEIGNYRLTTVTYGTGSASFLATRALQQATVENSQRYPKSCDVILNDFYVADLISGANTVSEAQALESEISEILNGYGFNLRKWSSNNVGALEEDHLEDNEYYIDQSVANKIRHFGLQRKTIKMPKISCHQT
ncbi:hypothetical protein ILUMI_01765 [Ignelater luminosus]|uniref:Peptidase aspartic putative domain-containing protein n=1 Tax=Ignelater luminosus TaxID=2038154 RepID=A0A8K0GH42_IGNLU|nr:hypothetical protein ILUMI_01765 [Ignelater luminosus]